MVLGGRLRARADARHGYRLCGAVARRAEAAAKLYLDRGGAALVVACGGCVWDDRVEADAIAKELRCLGVSPRDIVRERLSVSTSDNARYGAIAVAKRGIGRAIVVTCDWHLPRALSAFEREGKLVGVDVSGHGVPGDGAGPGPLRRAYRTIRERVAARIDVWR